MQLTAWKMQHMCHERLHSHAELACYSEVLYPVIRCLLLLFKVTHLAVPQAWQLQLPHMQSLHLLPSIQCCRLVAGLSPASHLECAVCADEVPLHSPTGTVHLLAYLQRRVRCLLVTCDTNTCNLQQSYERCMTLHNMAP